MSDSMDNAALGGVVAFLRDAERLKDVTRTSWTSTGRRESVAEHSWRLTLMAMLLAPAHRDVNVERVMQLCIVHDLGEAIRGDISAKLQPPEGKASQERLDLLELLAPLRADTRASITALWDEYEAGETREARLVKALDKLETIMQHNQGLNPPDFDYAFNLEYGQRYTAVSPLIAELRQILDEETRVRADGGAAADELTLATD